MGSEMSSETVKSSYSAGAQALITATMAKSDERTSGSYVTLSKDQEDVIFVRLPQVKALTGLSKSSLYALIRQKSFPAPVRLGPRTVAWVKSEVRLWALERVNASR
jgi:prophage regulatory protein